MNAAVVRRTQEALGKVIRRPPLTEKLLSKPPFRYLHDIVTEVIRNSGFMQGLYTDAEMKSDNVKDKEAKIRFLQKAIDVVALVLGEPPAAKPARIVAGHEPERTNELLQLIASCCLSKLSSDEAVKQVLAGEKGDARARPTAARLQDSDSKPEREGEASGRKDREDRNADVPERSGSQEHRPQEEPREESRPRDREKAREGERERHRDGERDKAKTRARPDRERDRGAKDRDVERDRERRGEAGKDKERWKDRDKARDRERRRPRNGEHPRDPDREKSREHDRAERRSASSGEPSRKLLEGSSKDARPETEADSNARSGRSAATTKTSKRRLRTSLEGKRAGELSLSPEKEPASCGRAKKEHATKQPAGKEPPARALEPGSVEEPEQESAASEPGEQPPEPALDTGLAGPLRASPVPGPQDAGAQPSPAAASDERTAALWRGNLESEPTPKRRGDSASDVEGEARPAPQEKPEGPESAGSPSDLPSSARRMPRPGSARPAPPRIKRQESAEVLMPDRTGSGKTVANVIVDSRHSDDEEDEQFVVEAGPQEPEPAELELVQAVEVEEDDNHGGLVKKILETKKDYEKLQPSSRPGERDKTLVSEAAWKKEKAAVSKEMERLRGSIQTLCRSALPLGKIMDYLQEDVDAMQHELQLWRDEGRLHAAALQKEQSITNGAVEPLKAELGELEQLIRDQQDKIFAVKANILRNEEKIQKMVHGINLSSRR